jgi:hypothetical protein
VGGEGLFEVFSFDEVVVVELVGDAELVFGVVLTQQLASMIGAFISLSVTLKKSLCLYRINIIQGNTIS